MNNANKRYLKTHDPNDYKEYKRLYDQYNAKMLSGMPK